MPKEVPALPAEPAPHTLTEHSALVTRGHIDAGPVVHGAGLLVPALTLAVLAYRLRAAQREVALANAGGATSGAGSVALRGTVRSARPGTPPVRVTVEQRGAVTEELKKGRVRRETTWEEIDRRVEAAPFELTLSDGTCVRVEPGSKPKVVDPLGPWARVGDAGRVATAEIADGDAVTVIGEWVPVAEAGGYRSAADRVLRLRVIASVDIAEAPQARAARLRWWMGRLAAGALLAQLVALPYQLAVFFGKTRSALVQTSQVVQKQGKSGKFDVLVVNYHIPPGAFGQAEAHMSDRELLAPGRWFPVRVSPLQTTLGPRPTFDAIFSILPVALLGVFCGYAVFSRAPRRWYETRLVSKATGGLD